MEGIRKLPFVLGCLAAMFTGLVSYAAHTDSRTIYMRMAIVIVVFFILGIYIRDTVLAVEKEVQKKKEEKLAEEEKLKNEAEIQAAAAGKHQANGKQPPASADKQPAAATGSAGKTTQAGQQAHQLDLSADDSEDDFQPLTVSRVVSSKIKE